MKDAATYKPRSAQDTLVFKLLNNHLEKFLATARANPDSNGLPIYVEKELRAFLRCGVQAYGYCLVRCLGEEKKEECRHDEIVPYSCKYRGFCPSCAARRMHGRCLFLTKHVLPRADYRQWVISLPFALRYWMAADHQILKAVNKIAVREISKHLRLKARRTFARRYAKVKCGLISFVQRSSSDLALNYHFHILALDGVYTWNGNPNVKPKFRKVPAPTNDEVEKVLVRIRDRVFAYLYQIGKLVIDRDEYVEKEDEGESMASEHSQIQLAAIKRYIALGKRAGERVRKIGASFGWFGEDVFLTGERSARVNGFSLHCNRRVKADKRDELEFLIRYVARGELSEEGLSLDERGEVILKLKRAFADGTTAVKFSPLEFIEKLAAIIPYPYKNLIIYSGVFAAASRMRPMIVPGPEQPPDGKKTSKKYYIPWAELLRHVFKVDLFTCPHCGGKRKIVAAINRAEVIRKILVHLELPPDPPAGETFASEPQYEDEFHYDYEG